MNPLDAPLDPPFTANPSELGLALGDLSAVPTERIEAEFITAVERQQDASYPQPVDAAASTGCG